MLEEFFIALSNKHFFWEFISQKTESGASYIPRRTKDTFQHGKIISVLKLFMVKRKDVV